MWQEGEGVPTWGDCQTRTWQLGAGEYALPRAVIGFNGTPRAVGRLKVDRRVCEEGVDSVVVEINHWTVSFWPVSASTLVTVWKLTKVNASGRYK